MSERRFFVEGAIEDFVVLRDDEHKHISRVLRLTAGEAVIMFCGDGLDYHGQISSISNNETHIKIMNKQLNSAEPTRDVVLFQAMPKGEKADLIVQKITELGLSAVVFFDSKFTVKKSKAEKADRFSRIALEAVKQCGRAKIPKITVGIGFDKAVELLKNFEFKLFANECEQLNFLGDYLPQAGKTGRVALVVGSEGGFSADEAKMITDCGAVSLSFGNRILRAETAAIAMSAIVMNGLGELR